MKNKKILRKITFHLYKDRIHQQTQEIGIYQNNNITGEKIVDPFKTCKTLEDIRKTLITKERATLLNLFEEKIGWDFILVKVNKKGLNFFQQIFPTDLVNSIRFIKED